MAKNMVMRMYNMTKISHLIRLSIHCVVTDTAIETWIIITCDRLVTESALIAESTHTDITIQSVHTSRLEETGTTFTFINLDLTVNP